MEISLEQATKKGKQKLLRKNNNIIFILFLLLSFSCQKQEKEKLDLSELKSKAYLFAKDKCDTTRIVQFFCYDLKERGLLIETEKLVNNLFDKEDINGIIFHGGLFKDKISIYIVTKSGEYIYRQKTDQSDLYFSSRQPPYEPNFTDSCIREKHVSGRAFMTLRLKLNEDLSYNIGHIWYYYPH